VPVPIAPLVAVVAIGLAVAPLLNAGAVRQIYPATSTEMVERRVPTTATYVGLSGFAMTVPYPAPGMIGRPPYGLLIRDTVASLDMTVVTADAGPGGLLARTVIGRMIGRPFGEAAAERFADRGEDVGGIDPSRVLLEVTPGPDDEVVTVQSVADLSTVPEGSLVSVPLEFDGESIPTCVLDGTCQRGVLAAGTALFVHLAHGKEGGPILVQTAYPSSVAPGQWAGPQHHWDEPFDVDEFEFREFDPDRLQISYGQALDDFVTSPGVQSLAGWGRVLTQASIMHDPDLIRDRLWLGPALLAVLAGLLWLGGRIGYPYFRPSVEGSRRWTAAGEAERLRSSGSGASTTLPEALPIRVSGHALTSAGQRRQLDEAAAVIRPQTSGDGSRVTASVELADGTAIPLAAHDTGLLGSVERGEVVSLGRVEPALWAHWYGTDLKMTFGSVADRDRAADLVSRG
jgi:hypothetical protein